MLFRRFLAVLLGVVFVASAQAAFLLFSFSHRLFAPEFYQSKTLEQPLYDLVTRFTAQNVYNKEPLLQKYFTESDLQREVQDVFTQDLFSKTLKDFTNDLEAVKRNEKTQVTFSFHVLRQSLLTMAHNLSFEIFQKIPRCKADQIPVVDSRGLANCVPTGAEYNLVSAPANRILEDAVYSTMPEQIQYDFGVADHTGDTMLFILFQQSERVLLILYIILLTLLACIALLVYRPFQHILRYMGVTLLASGVIGYLLSLSIASWPKYLLGSIKVSGEEGGGLSDFFYKDFQSVGQLMFSFLGNEVQKLALGFLGLGLCVILVELFLKKN